MAVFRDLEKSQSQKCVFTARVLGENDGAEKEEARSVQLRVCGAEFIPGSEIPIYFFCSNELLVTIAIRKGKTTRR